MSTEIPTIGDPVAVFLSMVAERRPKLIRLAASAASLFHVASYDAVPLLLPLLKHRSSSVRRGAVKGLAAHPFPLVLTALYRRSREDRSLRVRAAADKALDDFDATPIECIMCTDPAVLAPKPDSNPHGEQIPKPMFCTEACAVRWALGEAPDLYHHCVTALRWERGREDECDVCSNASVLGAEAGEEPR